MPAQRGCDAGKNRSHPDGLLGLLSTLAAIGTERPSRSARVRATLPRITKIQVRSEERASKRSSDWSTRTQVSWTTSSRHRLRPDVEPRDAQHRRPESRSRVSNAASSPALQSLQEAVSSTYASPSPPECGQPGRSSIVFPFPMDETSHRTVTTGLSCGLSLYGGNPSSSSPTTRRPRARGRGRRPRWQSCTAATRASPAESPTGCCATATSPRTPPRRRSSTSGRPPEDLRPRPLERP